MSVSSVWSGKDLLNAFALATELLSENRGAIDALNVYPVPDGDTGTNMSLTMDAALAEARSAPDDGPIAGAIAQRIARGSLLGARGNSGVILSQIWRGFAQELHDADRIDGRDMARALLGAADVAYKAVMKPVEGTMLTVIRVGAERAQEAARRDPAMDTVLEASARGATEALADTPRLLAQLRDAGVVDSGGQGVVLVLEAFLAVARGSQADLSALELTGPADVTLHADDHDSFGYCTNFMISGAEIAFDAVRDHLAAMGQSAVIVGDDRLVKVHIHVEDPGAALSYAVQWGSLSQIKIDNMNAQVDAFAEKEPAMPATERAIVAVASGPGIRETFRSLGIEVVLDGGSTMNPSIDELARAVERTRAAEVILLPNNGNVIMAANQVTSLAAQTVHVIPTRSIVQGIAAAAAFNPALPLDQVLDRMRRASERTTTIEVARADKDALVDGIPVCRGQYISIVDDKLAAASGEITGLLESISTSLVDREPELLTVYGGKDLHPDLATDLTNLIQNRFPESEVEFIDGGQPHYLLIIAAE